MKSSIKDVLDKRELIERLLGEIQADIQHIETNSCLAPDMQEVLLKTFDTIEVALLANRTALASLNYIKEMQDRARQERKSENS